MRLNTLKNTLSILVIAKELLLVLIDTTKHAIKGFIYSYIAIFTVIFFNVDHTTTVYEISQLVQNEKMLAIAIIGTLVYLVIWLSFKTEKS